MTTHELLAELRRRIAELDTQQRDIRSATNSIVPRWASYFQGYRDALGEFIEWLEEKDE